jgi:gliding motility-associated-like protein
MAFKKQILLFLGFLMFAQLMFAQIKAPLLYCVQDDTLKWQLPVNNCGSFTSYDIYSAIDRKGPYQLYASIKNPTITQYYQLQPLLVPVYFFMKSNYACTGIALSSDTLDNQLPETVSIKSASVVNGKVEISWEFPSSGEKQKYVIYKKSGVGVSPYDTVYNQTSYIDKKSTPNTMQETYQVIAADGCNNSSLFGSIHTSIRAFGRQDTCARSISLRWERYKSWKEGIEKHYIYVKKGLAPFAVVDSVAGSDSTYIYKNLDNAVKYTIYVRSIKKGNINIGANTSEYTCTGVARNVKNLFLQNVSVTAANKVELTWTWSIDADVVRNNILSSDALTGFKKIYSEAAKLPIKSANTLLDLNTDPTQKKIFYKINAIDRCKDSTVSNYASTIFLSGKANSDFTNTVIWTKFDAQTAGASNYELYKIIGTEEKLIGSYLKDTLFTDKVDPNNPEEAKTCYFVIASGLLSLPNGNLTSAKSRSNTICINQAPGIAVPNAFAPYGRNQEFKPIVSFANGLDYKMVVYDRFGLKIFETTDVSEGWNGQYNNKDLPQDTYPYFIKIKQSNGLQTEKKGSVMLLR